MRLILLDRDGVLNEDRPDSVKSPGELVMIAGAASAIARLNASGMKVALVTNQAIVGRGIIDEAMLSRIHEKLFDTLAREKARLDSVHIATDVPGAPSLRRKPAPGMLREAMEKWRATPAETMMIGDDLKDLEAAHAAGVKPALVRTGKGAKVQAGGIPPHLGPICVYDSLAHAVDQLLSRTNI